MNKEELIHEINIERAAICLDVLRGMRVTSWDCDIYEDKYLDAQALLLELIELIEES